MLEQASYEFSKLLSSNYYFEIAKKHTLYKFILSFEKSDFYHLAGLHKLTDIAVLQRERNKEKIFNYITDGSITYDLIQHSRFFPDMNIRLKLLGSLENILLLYLKYRKE